MITLESYSEEYHTTLLHDFFSRQEVLKYTNRWGYAMLSLLGIYKSYFMLLKDEKRLLGCGVIRYDINIVANYTVSHGGCMIFGYNRTFVEKDMVLC